MKRIESKGKLTWKFDSLMDYRRTMIEKQNGDGHSEEYSDRAWHGTKSWDEFITLLDNGDENVTAKIRENTKLQVAEMSKKYEEELINYKFDVTGQFFDIGLVLTGVPECWLEPEYSESEKVKVEITINASFPDGTDLDRIVTNAGKVLAMAKILEDHGVEVRLLAITGGKNVDHNRSRTFEMLFETVVKDYDEPLNYSKCSSIITPTYLRRGWFKMAEAEAGNLNDSYGQIIKVDNSVELRTDSDVYELEKRLFKKGGKR